MESIVVGEIDTKPIETVQSALCLFGEKTDDKKLRPTSTVIECEKERELEEVLKDLANYKLQLDAKDAAYLQSLLKLDQYQKSVDELSTQLNNLEIDRNQYKEAEIHIHELESNVKEMTERCSETEKLRNHLSDALKEIDEARKSELEAISKAELMGNEANLVEGKTEELLNHISELNQTILMLNFASMEAEKEKLTVLLKKDSEIELAKKMAHGVKKQLDEMEKQVEKMKALENEVLEMNQVKEELKNANEEVTRLSSEIEKMTKEVKTLKLELDEIRERENEAQIQIAEIKFELHKSRSKTAAAEAAEARAKIVKSEINSTVRQFTIEVEEAKKGKRILPQETDLVGEEETEYSVYGSPEIRFENSSPTRDKEITGEARKSRIDSWRKDSMEGSGCGSKDEIENLKRELEVAMGKIGEFRNRAEHAISRAEMAEKAKLALEEQLRRWREARQRRKAAFAEIKEVYHGPTTQYDPPLRYRSPTNQPLGKVLNMEF